MNDYVSVLLRDHNNTERMSCFDILNRIWLDIGYGKYTYHKSSVSPFKGLWKRYFAIVM